MSRRCVAVFGSSDPRPDSQAYAQALAVGRTLAELGYGVVNGGYGGVMEAASRGARDVGGSAIGVTCGVWRSPANDFLDEVVATANLPQRVSVLVDRADAGFVALPGATGTLSELAQVWERKCLGEMPDRPLVCVGDFWRPVIELMAAARASTSRHIVQIDGPQQLGEHFPPVESA
jgi:hypothetical protein